MLSSRKDRARPTDLMPHPTTALCVVFSLALAALPVITASAGDIDTEPSGSPVRGSPQGDPVELTDSISREFTVFVEQATDLTDAVSREFTVFSDDASYPTDAISREFTVFNDLVNPVEFTDAVSREMSAFVVIPIELGVPYEGALPVGSRVYFRLDTPPDLTVLINLDHASETAWTELYASFGVIPDEATAEFVFSNPSAPDQELVIPNTQGGSNFVLVRVTAEGDPAASSAFTLLAEAVPFGVDGVQPATVGAGEEVTLRVTGGHLEVAASIHLRHAESGTEITPVKTDVLDAAHARLRFNLLSAELGSYDLISESHSGQQVVLQDAVTIELPDEIRLEKEVIPSPALARRHGAIQGTTTLILRNTTNVDVPFTFLDIWAPVDENLTLTLNTAEPLAFFETEDLELGRFVIESIAPGEQLVLPVGIDIGRGYTESAVRIYSDAQVSPREQGGGGYLRANGHRFARRSVPPVVPTEDWCDNNPDNNACLECAPRGGCIEYCDPCHGGQQWCCPVCCVWKLVIDMVPARKLARIHHEPWEYHCAWVCSAGACTVYNCSADPNEKVGPPGHGDQRFVNSTAPMTYRLYFENMETATAPAAEVTITDVLDDSLSLASFRVRQFHFGATTVDVPEGRPSFSTCIDMVDEIGLLVCLEAGVNLATREATFILRALDPETMQVPAELDRGFLPPNDETGRGEGYVEFTITPNVSTPTGTVVTNRASIVFDWNDPITACAPGQESNPDCVGWFNTIDSGPPITNVQALTEESATPFVLRWDGGDDEGGSGLFEYRVYVRTDGGPAELWYSGTRTWAHFPGEVGSSYAFYSIGVDNVGNTESLPEPLDATTTVTALRRPGDIDLDGDTDLDDLIALVACLDTPLGPGVEAPSSCADADVNGDRRVDLIDFAQLQSAFGAP